MEDEEEEEDESEDLEVLPRPPAPTLSCLLPASVFAPPPCSAASPASSLHQSLSCLLPTASVGSSLPLQPLLLPPCLYSLLPASVCACAFPMKALYSECRCDMRARV